MLIMSFSGGVAAPFHQIFPTALQAHMFAQGGELVYGIIARRRARKGGARNSSQGACLG